jgi:hypothetical protein
LSFGRTRLLVKHLNGQQAVGFKCDSGIGMRMIKHAVYYLKYHLVWILKYRKHILKKEDSDYIKAKLIR